MPFVCPAKHICKPGELIHLLLQVSKDFREELDSIYISPRLAVERQVASIPDPLSSTTSERKLIQSLPTGPRANSSLYIYLSLPKLLAQKPPIPVFLSSNSVVLSPGNAQGVIPKELFSKVIRLQREIVKPGPDKSAGTNEQETQGQERQAEGEAKPKRDRKNREKPRFVEEIIWEDGAAVDPPRLVVPDSL